MTNEGKERGQARVRRRNAEWMAVAMPRLRQFAQRRRTFVMEEFRAWWLARDLPGPTHPNAWGALTTAAHKAELIRWTGRWCAASSPRTHGHVVRVWSAVS